MKIGRQIAAAMLLMSISVPAVKADLILDPKDVKTLKTLTNDRKKRHETTSSTALQPTKDKELNGKVSQPNKDKELNGVVTQPTKEKELNGITKSETIKVNSSSVMDAKAANKAKGKQ